MRTRFIPALVIGLAISVLPATAEASAHPLVAFPWSGDHAIYNTKSGRCLGIAADGNAGIWNCTYSGDQEWSLGTVLGADYYLIENDKNQCLFASGGQGAQVKAGLCNLTTSMGWRYSTDSHGRGVFENYEYGLILAVYSGETGNGSEVELYADTDGADQAWTLN